MDTPAQRAIRQQGRTGTWLARKLGVSQSHLWRQLAGQRAISPAQAQRMADLLGLPIELFTTTRTPDSVAS